MSTEFDNLQEAEGIDYLKKNRDNENFTNDHNTIIPDKNYSSLNLEDLIKEARNLLKDYSVNLIGDYMGVIRDNFFNKFSEFDNERKQNFINEGGDELGYTSDNSLKSKFNSVYHEYKTNLNNFFKQQEEEKNKNLKRRLEIIEELKALYQNSIESTNDFFKKFRDIKKEWHEGGRIPKNKSSDIFKTYYHHLDNTYKFIEMNKELQELDYSHNLEQRRAIINRATELVNELSVQKALNELQYLHKLWKEQGEPVAEEFRESTWQEFKVITQKVHERKSELLEQIKNEQENNSAKKKEILKELEDILKKEKANHTFWQNNIARIEELRENFFVVGKAPKEENNELWNKFKDLLHTINSKKNNFYKELKKSQQDNLNKKLELIEIAKSNVDNQDWSTSLELFKKIQNDWKKIGHVPRKYSDKLWNEFRTICNSFFDKYKNENNKISEEWKNNLDKKQQLLNEIENVSTDLPKEEVLKLVNDYNIQWNSIGKVPRENMSINKEYNKVIKNLLNKFSLDRNELNKLTLDLKVETYKKAKDNRKLDDELRKIKKNIQDLEHEIAQLENNFSFFSKNPNSPLLKNVINDIATKKENLEQLKHNYHHLINIDINEIREVEEDNNSNDKADNSNESTEENSEETVNSSDKKEE